MKEIIISAIIPTVTTIISALASMALLEFKKYIAAKTKNEDVNAAMTRITETVQTTVDNITQTVAGDLKTASGNGRLTGDQIVELKTMAYNTVVEQVPMAVRVIGDAVTSVQQMIHAKIEQAILRQKKGA